MGNTFKMNKLEDLIKVPRTKYANLNVGIRHTIIGEADDLVDLAGK